MPKESSIKSAGLSLQSVPAFWPMAMAMTMTMFEDIAIAEALDGKVVDWVEQVSDEQYRVKPEAA